jgi:hypothetical protein
MIFAVSDTVLVAIIAGPVVALIGVLLKWLDTRATRAKEELGRIPQEIESMKGVVEAMQTLANNQRTDLDRERTLRREAEERAGTLEGQLDEERALNVALSKQVEKLTKEARKK